MALIPAYQLAPRALAFEDAPYVISKVPKKPNDEHYLSFVKKAGGFDPQKRAVSPMRYDNSFDCYYYLDSITGAVEAGLVDDEKWPEQLFKTKRDMAECLAALSTYDDLFRIVDRWWQVLSALADRPDEEGMIRCDEIVSALLERADELKAFAR